MVFLHDFYIQCIITKNVSMYVHIKWWSTDEVLFQSCLTAKPVIKSPQFINSTTDNGFSRLCRRYHSYHLHLPVPMVAKWYEIIAWDEHCWPRVQKVFILTTSIGTLTFLFNLVIIITTLRSRILRSSVAHVLVANLAGGDLLISIYANGLTITVHRYTYNEYQYVYINVCRVLGVFLLAGQIITPLMTFVVTLERYLAIVYCLNSNLRISMKHAYITIIIFWIIAISSAVVGIHTPELAHDFDNVCVPLAGDKEVHFLTYPAVFLAFLYAITVMLYCHIYLNVRKTNQRTEQQRKDNSLARKIVLICLTNILCWIVPLLLSTLILHTSLGSYMELRDKKLLWSTLAPTSLIANSCCNPVLFSFRNETFRTEFLKQWPYIRSNQIRQQRANAVSPQEAEQSCRQSAKP